MRPSAAVAAPANKTVPILGYRKHERPQKASVRQTNNLEMGIRTRAAGSRRLAGNR